MSAGARITIGLTGALISLIASAQFVAALYQNHPALGYCLSLSQSLCLYPPTSFFHWLNQYGHDPLHRPIFSLSLIILILGLGLSLYLSVFWADNLSSSLMRGPAHFLKKKSHASAWGTMGDLKAAGLTHKEGIVFGRLTYPNPLDLILSPRLLTSCDMRPLLVTGGTRSGKGRGIVVPSLLNWSWSALIFDPKSELWNLTSGFRSSLGPTLFFNPLNPHTARFNPLTEIPRGDRALSEIQKLVAILIEPGDNQKGQDFWDKQGAEMLSALILHCLYSQEDSKKSLIGVKALSADLDETAKIMLATAHDLTPSGKPITHPYIEEVAKAYLSAHERGRKSVQMTVRSYLSFISSPEIERALSTSDFRLGDLMAHQNPVSLYIQIAPSELGALKPLTRLFFHLASSAFTSHIETDADGRPKENALLLMLDEFPLLGKISFFEDVVRLSSGYGIKCLFIAQSLNDIARIYGTHNGFLDNTHIYIAFSALDPLTRDKVSKLTGTVKDLRLSASLPHHFSTKGAARSISEIERPLLNPSEIGSLPYTEQLAFIAGHKPFRLAKLHYDKIEWMLDRSSLPAPDQSKSLLTPEIPAHPWQGVKPVSLSNPALHLSFEEKQTRPHAFKPKTSAQIPLPLNVLETRGANLASGAKEDNRPDLEPKISGDLNDETEIDSAKDHSFEKPSFDQARNAFNSLRNQEF